MHKEMIRDCVTELLSLEEARASVRTLIHDSYNGGAPLSFIESMEQTIALLTERVAWVEEVKAVCEKKWRMAQVPA